MPARCRVHPFAVDDDVHCLDALLRGRKGLIEVIDQVLGILQPNREAHQFFTDAGVGEVCRLIC